MQRIIFTSQASSAELCLNEMNKAGLKFKFAGWLESGIGIIETDMSFIEFSDAVKSCKLIFLRHICPVDQVIGIDNIVNMYGKKNDVVYKIVKEAQQSLRDAKSFSVQVRRSSSAEYDALELQRSIADGLKESGFILSVNNPDYIISVYIFKDVVYEGTSKAEDNLSSWPGGMRRYAMLPETVSRAEFKLLEALEYLGIDVSGGHALDLGAAPGGWSRVLAERGCKVDAVDPAELAESVVRNPAVTHYKCLAQEFAEHNNKQYDVIVNDMKMDVVQSVGIIMEFSDYLNNDGIVIMTFKLMKKNRMQAINKGLEMLNEKYTCVMVKQLFNNRSEITVVLKKQ